MTFYKLQATGNDFILLIDENINNLDSVGEFVNIWATCTAFLYLENSSLCKPWW